MDPRHDSAWRRVRRRSVVDHDEIPRSDQFDGGESRGDVLFSKQTTKNVGTALKCSDVMLKNGNQCG